MLFPHSVNCDRGAFPLLSTAEDRGIFFFFFGQFAGMIQLNGGILRGGGSEQKIRCASAGGVEDAPARLSCNENLSELGGAPPRMLRFTPGPLPHLLPSVPRPASTPSSFSSPVNTWRLREHPRRVTSRTWPARVEHPPFYLAI